jgi:hypothetical protein
VTNWQLLIKYTGVWGVNSKRPRSVVLNNVLESERIKFGILAPNFLKLRALNLYFAV